MNIFNAFFTRFLKAGLGRLDRMQQAPLESQEAILKELLRKGSRTKWGEQYDYSSIKDVHTYKQRFPIQNYNSLKPFIERMMNGEQKLLWPSKIKWFAKSSGTTSDKSKFIPVSKEALQECHYKAGRDTMALYLRNRPNTKIYTGKGLVMGGSLQTYTPNPNVQYGDVSAITMSNLPSIGEYMRTPSMKVALMDEWEEKIEKMAQETIKEYVTYLVGVPTWTLVLIKRIFELTGATDLKEVWPDLELYIHGAVSFTPYENQFKSIIREGLMDYVETYNASEGSFGVQDRLGHKDMLLMLDHGIFYEFLPLKEAHNPEAETKQLEEVEIGVNYAIIISTNAGLWRYMVGDTIQFTSLHPFRIKVSGRVQHFINAFGEEVIIENADRAIAKACQVCHATVNEYTVAPIYFSEDEKARHEWLIEFEHSPSDLDIFTKELDLALQAINSDYEAKRYKDIALQIPLVIEVKRNTFHSWLKERGKLGGQNKIPRLSNDRTYVEAIKQYIITSSAQ